MCKVDTEKATMEDYLADFTRLAFGFALLKIFDTLFATTRELYIRDLISWRVLTDPLNYDLWRGDSGAISAFFLGIALMVTYLQFFVLTQKIRSTYKQSYTVLLFALDMGALLLFFSTARSLTNFSEKVQLQPDTSWFLFLALHVVILVRLVRSAFFRIDPLPDKETASKYYAICFDSLTWYILSITLFATGWIASRYPLSASQIVIELRYLVISVLALTVALYWFIWYRDLKKHFLHRPGEHYLPVFVLPFAIGVVVLQVFLDPPAFFRLIMELRESYLLALLQCVSALVFTLFVIAVRNATFYGKVRDYLFLRPSAP